MKVKPLCTSLSVMVFVVVNMAFGVLPVLAKETCNLSFPALLEYEQRILRAAEKNDLKSLPGPLVCVLRMHLESDGFSRYLAASFLRPILAGQEPKSVSNDPRYQKVARALEKLALHAPQGEIAAFLKEFAKGDWQFYTLFCERGNTEFCQDFMPEEQRILNEPPLLAAASILRLRQAHQVLTGPQREQIARRLRSLDTALPSHSRLQRQLLKQVLKELDREHRPLS